MRKAFSRYDADGSGTIDRDEFAAVMKDVVGATAPPEKVGAVFDLFDADGNGTISAKEFTEALMDYGATGAAPPPSTRRSGRAPAAAFGRQDVALSQSQPAPMTVRLNPNQPLTVTFNEEPEPAAMTARPASRGAAPATASAASPRSRGPTGVREAISDAARYEELTFENMTDAEVVCELSDRLEAEGVPLHTLFKILCPGSLPGITGATSGRSVGGAEGGMMAEKGLRDLITKMGLGKCLGSAEEDRNWALRRGGGGGMKPAASQQTKAMSARGAFKPSDPNGDEAVGNTLGSGVGDAVGRTMACADRYLPVHSFYYYNLAQPTYIVRGQRAEGHGGAANGGGRRRVREDAAAADQGQDV